MVEIDIPDGHLCIYDEHRTEEIIYTVYSLFFGMRRSQLCAHFIETFGVCDRCRGVCCHRDPPILASPILRQDTIHSAYHCQGRHRLRPSSVHLPCRLRVLVGLRSCTCDTDSAQHASADAETLSRISVALPGSRTSDTYASSIPVRFIDLHTCFTAGTMCLCRS